MSNHSVKKVIKNFMSMTKENHPAIHEEYDKIKIKPIFLSAAESLAQIYDDKSGDDKIEDAKAAIRVFGNTCRNNATAIDGIKLLNNFLYNLNLSGDASSTKLVKRLHGAIEEQIDIYEDDEGGDDVQSAGKKVQAYICVYIGEMRSGLGADIRIIDSVEEYFKWFIAPYDLKVKDIKVLGSKLTADLQVDEENGLDVEIDFNDRDSFIKLEEDIDVTLFPDGSPWRTDFYPVYEGEPLKAGEIFSDSFR